MLHSTMSFNKHIQLCNHQHNHGIKKFHHPQNFFVLLASQPLSLYPQPLATTDLFSVSMVLPLQECHINGIIQCVSFWIWFLSLSIKHLRFIHFIAWVSSRWIQNKVFDPPGIYFYVWYEIGIQLNIFPHLDNQL